MKQAGEVAVAAAPVVERLAPARSGAASAGQQTFRSLGHRNFRLLWFGTFFSGCALWIQTATLGWLTYDLTGSALLLGAVNGVRSLPLLVLGPFGGLAADRFDRRNLMFSTQVALFVTTLLFATLIVSGQLQIWHIFVFTLLTGVAWAFNMPVRQSLVPSLVPRADLMNAVALNSAMFNFSRILGPTAAGILLALIGAGENFFLQAAAYLGVAIMVVQMRIGPTARAATDSVGANLREGAFFIWRTPSLRAQIFLALAPVVIALPYNALLPIFASDVLGVGPEGFGLLMAAQGIGAVTGTLTLASLKNVERKGLVVLSAVFTLGLFLALFSLSRIYLLSLVLLVLVGAVQMVYFTTNQALIQLSTPDDLRGRVMGVYMLNQGLMPFGSLLAGALAGLVGAPTAVLIMGLLVSALAVVAGFSFRGLRTS